MTGSVPMWVRVTFGWLAMVFWALAFVAILAPAGEDCPAPISGALSDRCGPESADRLAWGAAWLMLAVLMSFAHVVALLRSDDR